MLNAEPFLDATIASLKAGLPAAIAAINAPRPDFQVPIPADPDGYILGGSDVIVRYPAIEVAAPDWSLHNFSLGQVESDLGITVMVRAWLQNDANLSSFDQLYRGCMRMTRALLNVLTAPNAFGDHSTIVSIRGAYRVNPEANERQEHTMATLLVFTLEDVEVPG